MPRQILIQVIAQKQTYIQAVTAMAKQCPVVVDVVEITHQKHLEENNRLNARLAFAAIITLCCVIEKV